MSEIQEMRNEVAQLKQEMHDEIAQLKQENLTLKSKGKAQSLRQRFVLGLAVASVALGLMTHKASTQAKNTESNLVVCREIRVIDADRNTVLWLGVTKDGEGTMSVYNSGAKRIASISATSDTGAGTINLYDEEGRQMVSMGSRDQKGVVWTKK
jgi:hypothetical protein